MGALTLSDVILYAHPTFGVFGILAGVWVFVEALNASAAEALRMVLPRTELRAANMM